MARKLAAETSFLRRAREAGFAEITRRRDLAVETALSRRHAASKLEQAEIIAVEWIAMQSPQPSLID